MFDHDEKQGIGHEGKELLLSAESTATKMGIGTYECGKENPVLQSKPAHNVACPRSDSKENKGQGGEHQDWNPHP